MTEPSRFLTFDRMQWAALGAATPLTLDHGDVEALRGINERLSLDEVAEVYSRCPGCSTSTSWPPRG